MPLSCRSFSSPLSHFILDFHHGLLEALTTPTGANVAIERDRWRNLRQLSTPAGGRIELEVDALNRVSKAKSTDGAWADYQYDVAGRLVRAKTANYERHYQYRGTDLEALRDNGTMAVQLRYYGRRVSELLTHDGAIFKFAYEFDSADRIKPTSTRLTHPDGRSEKFDFTGK